MLKDRMYEIVGGPSKGDMIYALAMAYADHKRNCNRILFRLAEHDGLQREVEVFLIGLKHEDGSGNKFLLKGYVKLPDSEKELPMEAFYDALSKRGSMEIL